MTVLTKGDTKSNTLRATIPVERISELGWKDGDLIKWDTVEDKNGKHLIGRKVKIPE